MGKVEGKETHILLCHGAERNKPINFGSHKAEGNKTNTVFECRGGGGGHFWVFKVEGGKPQTMFGPWEMKPIFFGVVKLREMKPISFGY